MTDRSIDPPTKDDSIAIGLKLTPYTSEYITTINKQFEDETSTLVGSGIFIRDGHRFYILTAEHVMEERSRSWGFSYTNSGHRATRISKEDRFFREPLDISLVQLDSARFSRKAIDLSQFETNDFVAGDLLFVHGFPGEQSRFTTFGPGQFSDSLPLVTSGKNSAKHEIEVSYPIANVVGQDRQPGTLPLPPGLSGSPVWKVNWTGSLSTWKPEMAKMVGIVTRWHQDKQVIFATGVTAIRELVRQVAARNLSEIVKT